MEAIIGKYEFESVDARELDEFLKSLGVGLVLRKVLATSKPTLEITYSPDTEEWTISTHTPFKTTLTRFKAGKSTEDETYDARKCTTFAELKDGRITLLQKCEEGPDVKVVTEKVSDHGLKLTMSADGMSVSQLFKQVTPVA